MRRIQGGFRDVCCGGLGEHLCGEITEREMDRTFSRLLPLILNVSHPVESPHYFLPCISRFDPSSSPDGRGIADGGPGEDERTRLVLDITHVGQPKP